MDVPLRPVSQYRRYQSNIIVPLFGEPPINTRQWRVDSGRKRLVLWAYVGIKLILIVSCVFIIDSRANVIRSNGRKFDC